MVPETHAPTSLAAVRKQGTGCYGSALTYLCSLMGVEPALQLCLLAFAGQPQAASICLSCGAVKACVKPTQCVAVRLCGCCDEFNKACASVADGRFQACTSSSMLGRA